MSNHLDNIAEINKLIASIGEEEFKKCLNQIQIEATKYKQDNCKHAWVLSFMAGNGYFCSKCNNWKPEED